MESEPSYFLAAFVPRAICEFVRHILRKNAHGVLSARSNTRIMGALEIKLAPQMMRQIATARRSKSFLPFGLRQRRVDLAVVMRLMGATPRPKVGQFPEKHI